MTNSGESSRENYGHVSGDLFKWIVSAILGLVTTFGSAWVSRIQDQQEKQQLISNANAQKIASLETRVDITKEVSNQRLDRIEAKIDFLISDRPVPGQGK